MYICSQILVKKLWEVLKRFLEIGRGLKNNKKVVVLKLRLKGLESKHVYYFIWHI
jgi:hypothetical protein